MDKDVELKIIKFMKNHQELTLEQMKKSVRSAFPEQGIYNEDIERLMIKTWQQMRKERDDDAR